MKKKIIFQMNAVAGMIEVLLSTNKKSVNWYELVL